MAMISDFPGFITPQEAAPIFNKAAESSVVQRLAQRVELGASGTAVPVMTGTPVASWVAEGARKPTTDMGMAMRVMEPKKLACIVPISEEVARVNPGGITAAFSVEIAKAFALAFDIEAMHGAAGVFASSLDDTTNVVELQGAAPAATALYDDLNSGLKVLVDTEKTPNGFLFDNRVEPLMNAAKDNAGRPLWIDAPTVDFASPVRDGRLFGRPAAMGRGVFVSGATDPTLGYVGDWSQTAWGTTGGITLSMSDSASWADADGVWHSAFQENMILMRAEAEYGYLINDTAAFAKYVNAA